MLHASIDRRRFLKATLVSTLVGGNSDLRISKAAAAEAAAGPEPEKPGAASPGIPDEIERLRAAALDVLKPSDADLQHGLELHQQSVVFDCYGFAPQAPLDLKAFEIIRDSGASDRELDDLRGEMSATRCVTDAAVQAEFKRAWRAAGVTCIFQNAGEEGQDPMRLLKRLARFIYVTDHLSDFVTKATTPGDIVAAKQQDRQCFYLTGNGVPLRQDWASVEDELGYVRIFFQLGIRMMHLTYNRRNMIGDGCAERANGGLSDFGRAAIAEMNRIGVIPDVAHSGWRTSLEAAQVSARPVVASHSTCAALQDHIRAKPDDVLKALASSGGLIGICCISDFLGGKGDLPAFLDHIDYAVKTVGIDHVGIGTDTAYASRSQPQSTLPTVNRPRPANRRQRFEALWPAGALGKIPAHPSIAWTNWPLFTVGLVQRGYKDDDIRKLIGGNMLRVAGESLSPPRP